MCTTGYAKGLTHHLTQNQLTELFETEHIKALIERAEERGWVEPAEVEVFALEHDLADDEVEQITRELEAMGLEVGAPQADAAADKEKDKEAAENEVWAAESISGAADSLQLFLADVGKPQAAHRRRRGHAREAHRAR